MVYRGRVEKVLGADAARQMYSAEDRRGETDSLVPRIFQLKAATEVDS